MEVVEVVSAEDTTSTTSVAQGYLWATPGLLLCTFDQLFVNFWSTFGQLLVNFWSTFDQLFVNF